tara:strand:- start:14803 stop:15726 length:924 start_codon:yes stop_codon:yes gene_type:complete
MARELVRHPHAAIMKEEVVDALITNKSGTYLDFTVGFGGHADHIIQNLDSKGRLIGLDCDPDAFKYSFERFFDLKEKVKILNENYTNYNHVLDREGIPEVDGFLMDLGISSYQVDKSERGFSYQFDAPLDMRFDINYDKTASDILNTYSVDRISEMIKCNGEEKNHMKIAKSIVQYSKKGKMKTSFDLRKAVIDSGIYVKNINKVFSRVFQAIRIEVNDEFVNIEKVIKNVCDRVKIGGRAVFITFHSLEDRLVKQLLIKLNQQSFNTEYGTKKIDLVRKKVIKPERDEILRNKRARSAKLRFICIK